MAINTEVFVGSDATLTLAVDSKPGSEGTEAKSVIDLYKLSPVGRARNVTVRVETDLEFFHEVGKRYASSLRAGNVYVTGTMDRAYINGALLQLLLGEGAKPNRKGEPYASPAFNMVLLAKDPSAPTVTSTLNVHGVKFNSWTYTLPEDDFVMESVSFKALYITVEDK